MSDSRRKAPKIVRWEPSHSGSSRVSTVGGSSTSSGHSGSQYTAEYNIGALEKSLRSTILEVDDWKRKAEEADQRLRQNEDLYKARIKALELSTNTLEQERIDFEKELRELKKENLRLQRKLDNNKHESHSEPSSPDSGKPRRSDSKRFQESEADKHNDRLKERFNRTSTGEPSSESHRAKPPSSSRSKHSSGRRMSASSEKSPYLEDWGGAGPSASSTSPTASSSRRPPSEYIMTSMPVLTSTSLQSPVYASIPRSTPISAVRPTVEYATYGLPQDTGAYQYARR